MPTSIKKPILLLFIVSASLWVAIVALSIQRTHHALEHLHLERTWESFEIGLKGALDGKSREFEGLVRLMQRQSGVSQALAQGDRARLLQELTPLWQATESLTGSSRLTFLTPDLHVLLRLHRQDDHGDAVTHAALLEAARTGEPAKGMEPALSGALTWVVVHPWRDGDGNLLGYSELGANIGPMIAELERIGGIHAFSFILKSPVRRDLWETSMRQHSFHWNRYTHIIPAEGSRQAIPSWLTEEFMEDSTATTGKSFLFSWYWLDHHEHFRRMDLFDGSKKLLGWIALVAMDENIASMVRRNFFVMLAGLLALSLFMIYVVRRRLRWVERNITESVEHLRQSETRCATIINSAMDAFIRIDSQGTILEFNSAAENIFGYSRAEIIGARVGDTLIPEEERKRFVRLMKKFSHQEDAHIRNQRLEMTALHKNGMKLHVDLAISVISLVNNTFFAIFLRDLTQRIKIDKRLRLQSAAMEAAANPIVITDCQGIIQWINPAFTRLTGYQPEEALGLTPKLLKSGEHDQKFYETLWKTILSGTVWHHEIINCKKDGTRYVQDTVITPVRDEGGNIRHFIAIQQDITDRKRIENERNRFWMAVEQSPVSTVITDPEGLIEYVNPQFTRATGYDQHEVIGKNPRILKSDATPPSMFAEMWQTISSGGIWRGELLNRKKSGALFWESTLIAPIFNDSGRIQHYLAIKEDITEKKAYETTLEEARLKADAANRAKSEFLATMSHEIRTPMNGVLGMMELLLESPLHPEQRKHAQTVYRSGETLLTLLNDILDLSRIEASQIKLEHTSLDLKELLGEVADVFSPLAHGKSLSLNLTLDPPGMNTRVLGDPVRLRQILVNLTGNAVKFTERGEVTIRLFRQWEQQNRTAFRFEVEDTGIGIDEGARERLFHPFVQADSTTTRRYGGSGLGLSIVRKLVELMGGTLGLQSVPGQGSTFWFEVVFVSQPVPEATVVPDMTGPRRTKHPTASVKDRFPGVRILVAEDFEINRDVILEMLHKLECEVHWAENGRRAVEMAAANRYDLIFMDMNMPEMDGITATAHIRHFQETSGVSRSTPIVAVTADAMSGDRERYLAAGVDDYIAKPFRLRDLAGVLSQWLPNRASSPAVAVMEEESLEHPEPAMPSIVASDDGVLDDRELERLRHEVGDELGTIVHVFLKGLDERVQDIVTAESSEALVERAHRLKGGARILGARQLADLCQSLEQLAKKNLMAETVPLIDELKPASQRAAVQLRQRFGDGGVSTVI
ncbi:MAG: PAS domain S-box protein [Magnetococcales bacterium]|nr:PAS domain S-box protein [Magnetococcales bacterium]